MSFYENKKKMVDNEFRSPHFLGIVLLLVHISIAVLLIFSSESPELYRETTNISIFGSYFDVSKSLSDDKNLCMYPKCGNKYDPLTKVEELPCVNPNLPAAADIWEYNLKSTPQPICNRKPNEDDVEQSLLTIQPEYHSAYEQETGNAYSFDGEFTIKTDTVMPIQCTKNFLNGKDKRYSDDKIIAIGKLPSDDYWVNHKDCKNAKNKEKCRENICEYFFYQINANMAILSYEDANDDLKDMCWIPRTEEDLFDTKVASDFVKRSNLEVVVYPLKNGVDESSAKTAAAKVCSLTFVIGRKEAQNENTDEHFSKYFSDQRFLVCYHDVDESDSSKKLFGSKKDSITSTSKFSDEDLYEESEHLSVFWAIKEFVHGYQKPGTEWTSGSFLDDAIYVDGLQSGILKFEVLGDANKYGIDEVTDPTASSSNSKETVTLYAKLFCNEDDNLYLLCAKALENVYKLSPDKEKWAPKAGDMLALPQKSNAALLIPTEIDSIKRFGNENIFKIISKATANAGTPAVGFTNDVFTQKKNLQGLILQDFQTFRAAFFLSSTKTAGSRSDVTVRANGAHKKGWGKIPEVHTFIGFLGPKIHLLGEVCQWSRQVFAESRETDSNYDTFAERSRIKLGSMNENLQEDYVDELFLTNYYSVSPPEKTILEAQHYAQSKELYLQYDKLWEEEAKKSSSDIPNQSPSCDSDNLRASPREELDDTYFGTNNIQKKKKNIHGYEVKEERFKGVNLLSLPKTTYSKKSHPSFEQCQTECKNGNRIHNANMYLAIIAVVGGIIVSTLRFTSIYDGKSIKFNYTVAYLSLLLAITGVILTFVDMQRPADAAKCVFENIKNYIDTSHTWTKGNAGSRRLYFIEILDTTTASNKDIPIATGSLFGVSILFHIILIIISNGGKKLLYTAGSSAFLDETGF